MIRLPPRRPQRAAPFGRLRGRLPPLPPLTYIVRSAAPFGHLAALKGRQAGQCPCPALRLCSAQRGAVLPHGRNSAYGCCPHRSPRVRTHAPVRLRWRNSKAVRSCCGKSPLGVCGISAASFAFGACCLRYAPGRPYFAGRLFRCAGFGSGSSKMLWWPGLEAGLI